LGAVVALIPGKIGSKAKGYFHPSIPLSCVVSPLTWQLRKLGSLFNNNLSYESAFDFFVAHAIENGRYQAAVLVTLQDYMPATVRAAKKRGWKIWSDQISNQSDEMAMRIAQHEQSLGLVNSWKHNEKINDEMIANSDVITVPSNYTLDGIKSRVSTITKVHTIPYGASEKQFAGTKLIDDSQIVILARAHSVRKGGHLLLQALQHCSTELLAVCAPKRIKVVILGNLEPDLFVLLNELILPEGLTVTHGNVPHTEVSHLYRKASLFVMPSLSEGMSLACMEAMHAGLPLIITRYCGIDGFEHGCMGYEIADSSESLSSALIDAFTNRELWSQWGINSQRLGITLTWTEYERNIRSLTKELLC
jgi:glycosyltransferase involved in cell wall biosynthesis